MRRSRLSISVVLVLGLVTSGAAALERDEAESCQAVNPVQTQCSFTVTSLSTSETVTGAVGQGEWLVLVKRKKVKGKIRIEPSTTDPEPVQFDYEIGDKVTATALTQGSWVIAGHD